MKKSEEIHVRREALEQRLKHLDLSLEDISEDVGVDTSTLYRWKGGQEPKLPGVIALALRIRMPLGELLGIAADPDYEAILDLEFSRRYGRAALLLAKDDQRREEEESTGLRKELLNESVVSLPQQPPRTSPDQSQDSKPPAPARPRSKKKPSSKPAK